MTFVINSLKLKIIKLLQNTHLKDSFFHLKHVIKRINAFPIWTHCWHNYWCIYLIHFGTLHSWVPLNNRGVSVCLTQIFKFFQCIIHHCLPDKHPDLSDDTFWCLHLERQPADCKMLFCIHRLLPLETMSAPAHHHHHILFTCKDQSQIPLLYSDFSPCHTSIHLVALLCSADHCVWLMRYVLALNTLA